MSGGFFGHHQYKLEQMADEVDQVILKNDSDEVDSYGDRISRDLPPDIIESCKHAANLLREAQVYVQRIDWLLSRDDGEDAFRRRLLHDLALLRLYDLPIPDDGITRIDAETARNLLDNPASPTQTLLDILEGR